MTFSGVRLFYRVTWNYNMVTLDGHTRWQSTEELTEVAKKSLTLKDGLGTVSSMKVL